MYTSFRTLVSWLLFVIILSTVSRSQTIFCVEPGGVPIDTMTVTADPDVSAALRGSSGTSTQIIWEIVFVQISGGHIDIAVDASSIHFSGDGWKVDAMSTLQIFDMIGEASIRAGITAGHIQCSDSCTITHILLPACVARLGTGLETHFAPCGPQCCIREYSVCCPPGIDPVITLLSASSPGCSPASSGECEPTCGEEEGKSLSALPSVRASGMAHP
jgi:hypothetical protein